MCKEYSCIVFPDGSVLDGHPLPERGFESWTHSHSEILKRHKIPDDNPSGNSFARVEIDLSRFFIHRQTPLTRLSSWLKIDQSITPRWFKDRHRKAALRSCLLYIKKRYLPSRILHFILHESTLYKFHPVYKYNQGDGTRTYLALMVGTRRFRAHYPHKNPLYRKALRTHLKYAKECLGSERSTLLKKSFPLK